MKADAVFEGGGVKGVAFIGAIREMEERGYSWERIAGTSAGSIIGALLCAGYRSDELLPIFMKLNYLMFTRRRGLLRLPVLGTMYQLWRKKGMYASDPIEAFVSELLQKKGVRTFGDLPQDKLRIVASDVTEGQMLLLPDDLSQFDVNPADFPIATAVRISSSIPYFFEPFLFTKNGYPHYLVDGALLSNFPVWLFDSTDKPRWPTFGFRFAEEGPLPEPERVDGLMSYTKAIISTLLDARDQIYIKRAHAVRTIFIPTLKVKTTQFAITEAQKKALIESGQQAVRRFFENWDFEQYCREYRNGNSS